MFITQSNPMYQSSPLLGHNPMMGTQMMMMQMMQIMMSLMSLMGGGSAMSSGMPGFGQGGHQCNCGGGSPANFLGLPQGGWNGNSGGHNPFQFGGGSAPNGGNGSTAPTGQARPDTGTPQSAGGGYIKPLDGNFRISSGFGPRRAPTAGASTFHKGVDLAAPTGTPVRATKGGKVSISQHQRNGSGRSTGYGNWIEIKHDDGTSSRYGHLNSRDVQVGQRIEAGQLIGTVGNTGTSTGAHLHFEVRNRDGKAVDPQKIMRF